MKTPGDNYRLPNKNYIAGRNYESRFLAQLLDKGIAVKGGRFYGSRGVTDVWWVDQKGIHHEAQLKYSKNKPYIAPHEMQKLREFSRKFDGTIKVWLVKKQSRKTVEMELVV